MRHLYVMLSRTDTGMGRFIRFFTRSKYNHISLCVDDELRQFVSFARHHQDVPLAGGAVTEPPERLLSCGQTIPVKIYRLDITQDDARLIESLFAQVGNANLVYNSLGALLVSCHVHCCIPGAYTCLEFTDAVLGTDCQSIQAIETLLAPWLFYQGDLFDLLQDSGNRSDPFFEKQGFWKGTWETIIHFKTLLCRILRLERPQDPITAYNLNILDNAASCKSAPKNS